MKQASGGRQRVQHSSMGVGEKQAHLLQHQVKRAGERGGGARGKGMKQAPEACQHMQHSGRKREEAGASPAAFIQARRGEREE